MLNRISEDELQLILKQHGDDVRIGNLVSDYKRCLKAFDNCPEGGPYCF